MDPPPAGSPSPDHHLPSGIAAGFVAVVTYAAMLVAGRIAATGDALTIYDLAALRMGVAAVCAAPVLVWAWPWRLSLVQHATIAFFGGAPFVLLLFAGMIFAPVAHATIVVNGTLPVLAAAVSWWWLGERPHRWQWTGIVFVVAGVAATGADALAFGVPGQWRGHLLFIGAAGCVAMWYAAMRAWRLAPLPALAALLVGNAVIYIPVWLLFLPSGIATAPWRDIALQAVVHGVFGAFIAIFFHAHSVRTLGATRQAAMMSAAPAVATLLAIPMLGEVPGAVAIAGVVIVTAGILMTVASGLALRPAGGPRPAP